MVHRVLFTINILIISSERSKTHGALNDLSASLSLSLYIYIDLLVGHLNHITPKRLLQESGTQGKLKLNATKVTWRLLPFGVGFRSSQHRFRYMFEICWAPGAGLGDIWVVRPKK